MSRITERRHPRALAGMLVGAMVAVGAIVGVASPAAAAEGDVSGATLDWGVKESWRGYVAGFGGSATTSGGASTTPAPYRWGTTGTGTFDEATQSGSFSLGGSVEWTVPAHGIDIVLANPTVTVSGGSGTLAADYSTIPMGGGAPITGHDTIATFTTEGGTVSVADGTASFTGLPALAGPGMTTAFGASYPVGTAIDPISFSFTYEQAAPEPQATSVSLSVSPEGPVEEHTEITLSASVLPAAAGTVQFQTEAGSFGDPVTVVDGTATLVADDLAVGAYSFTAAFTPADPAAFAPSASGSVSYEIIPIDPGEDALETTTSLAVSPDAPVVSGDATTLTAMVAADGAIAQGSVEFFDIADGSSERVSLGTAALADGSASLETQLAAGGHTFAAVYTPSASGFLGSEGASTENYGVVDTSVAEVCTPGANAVTSDGATASWDWNEYSSGWTKVASGDIAVDGQTFRLSDGTVSADAGCAVVSFEGTIRVEAYASFFPPNGQWVELVDPALTLSADGAGSWSAGIRAGAGELNETTLPRTTIATFSGQDAGGPGSDGEREIAFDYAGTTASGTWVAGYSDAWTNAFVLQVPSSIQAFYYRSSESAAQATKPPAPLAVDFEWPAVSSVALTVSPDAPVVVGDDVQLTATVTPADAGGTVTFYETSAVTGEETEIGSAPVADGSGSVTTDSLTAGGHTFRAVFEADGLDGSQAVADDNFGVVDTTEPDVCEPGAGALTASGVSAAWDWSEYSSGWTKVATGDISVDGQTFRLAGGEASFDDGCAAISFTGTLRTEAYASFFPPNGQWVELVDPVLSIAADGSGSWSAGVRAGAGLYEGGDTVRTTVATFSGAELPAFESDIDQVIAFDYADTTATGTWAAEYSDAWTNAFVLQVPSSIQAFYYRSSESAAQATKPPSPLSLTWAVTPPIVTVSATEVAQGKPLTITGIGYLPGERVQATITSETVDLGTATADASGRVSFSWTVPADFEVGAHSVHLTGRLGTVSAPFSVVASSIEVGEPSPGGGPAAAEEQCVARVVSGASLDWGVKASFRSYIAGPIAHGAVSAGGGVTVTDSGYHWSGGSGSYNTTDDRGRVSFGGSLRFTGHDGQLDLTISGVRVQVNGAGSALLIADVTSKAMSGPDVNASGIVLATLSLPAAQQSGSSIGWSGASATLTETGATAFGGFYQAGEALDPVSFTLPLGAETECDTFSSGSLSSTGGTLDAAGIALVLLLLGAGGLVIARRRQAAHAA